MFQGTQPQSEQEPVPTSPPHQKPGRDLDSLTPETRSSKSFHAHPALVADATILGVDSTFFSTIVCFNEPAVSLGVFFNGFLKRRIPGKNGEGSPIWNNE